MAEEQTLAIGAQDAILNQAQCGAEEAAPPAESHDSAWDLFVQSVPGGDVVQSTAWGEAKRPLGFEAIQAVVRADRQIIAGAQILAKRLGPFGAIGYVARGPLVGQGGPAAIQAVISELESVARARKLVHLIIQPPASGGAYDDAFRAAGYRPDAPLVAPAATLRLDLAPDLDAILADMSASQRRHLRQCRKQGVETRLGTTADIDRFHHLHAATARRQGFSALSRDYIRHQWDTLRPSGAVQLVFAAHGGHDIAGIWLTAFGDTVTYRLPGWDGANAQLHANIACHWHAINWAKVQGYRYYDLGGINRSWAASMLTGEPLPEALLRSPAAFKTRFGAQPVVLPSAWQRSFNPIVRLAVATIYPWISRSDVLRRLVHTFRNG